MMSSDRQDSVNNIANSTVSYSALVAHADPDLEDFEFTFSTTYPPFLDSDAFAIEATQQSTQSLRGNPESNATSTANYFDFNPKGSNHSQQIHSNHRQAILPLHSQATFTQRQSLLSGNENAIKNLANLDSLPNDINYFNTSILPVTTTGRSMASSYNNDLVAASAMNLSMPHTPRPTSRYHDLEDRIENSGAPSSTPPTPSTDDGWLSSSANSQVYTGTTPELADESDAGEDSDDETVDAGEDSGDGTLFASLAAALHWQLQQQKATKKAKDKTLPTAGKKRGIVADMVTAFGYMGPEAMTNPNGTQRCTTVTAGHIKHALDHPEAIEVLCWNLLEETNHRCEGKPLSAVYAPLKVQMKEATFANRIKGVIRALKVSKNVCKHLFEPPFASRVVGSPWAEIQKVERNVNNNKRKQALMKKGIQLEKGEQGKEAGEGGAEEMEAEQLVDEDETENEDGEPQPKRSRRRRSTKA